MGRITMDVPVERSWTHCSISERVFKCVGNVASLVQYANAVPQRAPSHWSAVYVQLNAAHAAETVAYRWDMGFPEALLLGVQVECEALLMWDPLMARSDVNGEVCVPCRVRISPTPFLKNAGQRFVPGTCRYLLSVTTAKARALKQMFGLPEATDGRINQFFALPYRRLPGLLVDGRVG